MLSNVSVAYHVVTKGCTINRKVLEMALVSQIPCPVQVKGFNPNKLKLYETFFSSSKRGGTIVDMSVRDEESILLITFETPEGKNSNIDYKQNKKPVFS